MRGERQRTHFRSGREGTPEAGRGTYRSGRYLYGQAVSPAFVSTGGSSEEKHEGRSNASDRLPQTQCHGFRDSSKRSASARLPLAPRWGSWRKSRRSRRRLPGPRRTKVRALGVAGRQAGAQQVTLPSPPPPSEKGKISPVGFLPCERLGRFQALSP